MRQTTPRFPAADTRRGRLALALAAAVGLCILAILALLLLRLLRPQPELRMRLLPAAAPLSELQEVLITTSGWRRGERVTICLTSPETLTCAPEAIVAEEQADREGIVEVTAEVNALVTQGLTRVVAAGEASGAVERSLRILQEPVALARPSPSLPPTNTPLADFPPSDVVVAPPSPTPLPPPSESTSDGIWRGEFFDNRDLTGPSMMTLSAPALSFTWGLDAPAPNLPVDGFAARWTTQQPFQGRRYRFTARADDGVRVWIDDALVLDEWHDSTSETTYVFSLDMIPGDHVLTVEYYEDQGEAYLELTWQIDDDYPEWRGEYFANPSLTGEPDLIRNDEVLEFDWGPVSPAGAMLPADAFSARWARTLPFLADTYRFELLADDGARLFIDGQLALDAWSGAGPTPALVDWTMSEGMHEMRVEYFEDVGDASISLQWYPAPPTTPTPPADATATPPTTDTATSTATPSPAATLTATPALRVVTVQPTQGWIGTSLMVTSSGWEPGRFVTLALLELAADISQADDLMQMRADSNGNVTFQFQFPDEPRWSALSQVQIVLHNDEWTTRGAAVFTLVQP